MKLKHILNEISYGSLIDKEKYNDLDNADKTLYRYTADSISKIDHYFYNIGNNISILQMRNIKVIYC